MKRRLTHDLAALSGTAYRARYRDEAHEAFVNRNRLGASSGGSLGLRKAPRVQGSGFRVQGSGFRRLRVHFPGSP